MKKFKIMDLLNIKFNMKKIVGTPRYIKLNRFKFKTSAIMRHYNIKKILYPKLTNFLRDTDKDGVPNIVDCQPYNRRRQDVKPNILMMERIRKLPIYITKKQLSSTSEKRRKVAWGNIRHITAKDVPHKERQQVYSVLKKYPSLVSDIERSKTRGVLFTGKDILIRGKPEPLYKGNAQLGERTAVISTKDISRQGLEGTREVATTVGHELKHVRQGVYVGKKGIRRLFVGEYWDRPGEVKAREAGTETFYSQPHVTKKIFKRKLAEGKERIIITLPETTERQRVSREEVERGIQEYEAQEEQQSMAGLRRITKEEENNETNTA